MHTIVEFGEDMRLLWIPKMLILVLGCEDFVLTNLEVSNGANLPRQETDRNGISQYSSRFTALFLAFDHSTQEICFQGSLAMRYLLNGSTWKRRAKRPSQHWTLAARRPECRWQWMPAHRVEDRWIPNGFHGRNKIERDGWRRFLKRWCRFIFWTSVDTFRCISSHSFDLILNPGEFSEGDAPRMFDQVSVDKFAVEMDPPSTQPSVFLCM